MCEQKKNKAASRNGVNYVKCEHSSFKLEISTCFENSGRTKCLYSSPQHFIRVFIHPLDEDIQLQLLF